MPALEGAVVMTLRDETGALVIQSTINFDPATSNLVDRQVTTTDGPRSGAVIIDNQTNGLQKIAVTNAQGVTRRLNISKTGEAFTAAVLAGQGLATLQDVNGLTFELT